MNTNSAKCALLERLTEICKEVGGIVRAEQLLTAEVTGPGVTHAFRRLVADGDVCNRNGWVWLPGLEDESDALYDRLMVTKSDDFDNRNITTHVYSALTEYPLCYLDPARVIDAVERCYGWESGDGWEDLARAVTPAATVADVTRQSIQSTVQWVIGQTIDPDDERYTKVIDQAMVGYVNARREVIKESIDKLNGDLAALNVELQNQQ